MIYMITSVREIEAATQDPLWQSEWLHHAVSQQSTNTRNLFIYDHLQYLLVVEW